MAGTWFTISLVPADVSAGYVTQIRDTFIDLLNDAGAPHGAAMFGVARSDGGQDLYFTPAAGVLANAWLKAHAAVACLPPVNEGDTNLLVGHDADRRLLNS